MAHHDTVRPRARLPVAGRLPHPAGHHQVRGRQAERGLRHRGGRRAGDPADRGQHPLLLRRSCPSSTRRSSTTRSGSSPRASTWPTRSCACGPGPRSCCAPASRRPGSTSPPTRRTCWASSPTSSSPRTGSWTRWPARSSPARSRRPGRTSRSLLQSSRPESEALAREVGADFLLKGSPTLLDDLRGLHGRELRLRRLRLPHADGTESGRACDLRTLQEAARDPAGREPHLPRRAQRLLPLAEGPHRVPPGPSPPPAQAPPTTPMPRPGAATSSTDQRLPPGAEPGAR